MPRTCVGASAAIAALGCEGGELQCTASADGEIATVATVAWNAREPAMTRVQYGVGALDRSVAERRTEAGTVSVDLYGVPPLQTVRYRVESEGVDSGRIRACEGEIDTRNVPVSLPSLEITVDETAGEPDPATPYLVGAMWSTSSASFAFSIDRAGQWLWYREYPIGLQPFEVLLATDSQQPGDGLLVNEYSSDHGQDLGQVRRLSWSGAELDAQQIEGGHHMFAQLPDGTLAWLAIDVRPWEDPDSGQVLDVVGDQVIERAPNGAERVVFSTWDLLPVTRGEDFDSTFYPQGKDWTHANAIQYVEAHDSYLVSLDNLRLVIEVDRNASSLRRSFGVEPVLEDTFVVADGSLVFEHQHDARLEIEADGTERLRMFCTSGRASGGVLYAIEDTGELRELERVGFELEQRSAFLGQMVPLANGNVLLNYASAGTLVELAPDGQPVWELRTGQGVLFGNVHPIGSEEIGGGP
jgi:hypothetical protein